MKEMDIHSITIKKWKATFSSKQAIKQHPNPLKQDFSTTDLNRFKSEVDNWYYLYSAVCTRPIEYTPRTPLCLNNKVYKGAAIHTN